MAFLHTAGAKRIYSQGAGSGDGKVLRGSIMGWGGFWLNQPDRNAESRPGDESSPGRWRRMRGLRETLREITC